MCKNSNDAIAPTLYMRQHCTLPLLFQVTHLKSRCFTHPRGFTADGSRSSTKDNLFNSPPTVKADHQHTVYVFAFMSHITCGYRYLLPWVHPDTS